MRVIRSLEHPDEPLPAAFLAIGFFDGVHLGHQKVMGICRDMAGPASVEPWVMTFDPHPLQIVNSVAAPMLLTDLSAKLELIGRHGMAGCVVVPFTKSFSHMEPETFLQHLIHHVPRLKGVVVGGNWRFGHKARGDVALLEQFARARGMTVVVSEAAVWQGQPVSSTRIREALAGGLLVDTAAMLGRPHAVRGEVVDGAKRGRKLGFPTANLDLSGYALPPPGIYAARVRFQGRRMGGAVYLPAPPHAAPGLLEVHLIDFSGDLYGQQLDVEFAGKIRDDNMRFANEADLIRQIRSDVEAIRSVLASST